MSEITFSRGSGSNKITLRRGGREVTFEKVPDTFAVRLTQGRATDEMALESALGRTDAKVTHVDATAHERMDLFRVEATDMEETVDRLRASANADVVTHVYTIDEATEAPVIPVGTLTIQFQPDVKKAEREAILAEFGLAVVEDLDFLEDGYTVRLTDASSENPLKISAALQQRDEIKVAEPDVSVPVTFEYKPADTLYPHQWHLTNRGDRVGLTAGADVKAEGAWETGRGSSEIIVCVMDDGFDLGHPDFNVHDKIAAPRDFGGSDLDPSPSSQHDNHGTACAGVAIAAETGSGVVGLAPGCRLMPIRMGDLSDNAVVDYFQYAVDNAADVISCSWSAKPWNFPLSTKIHAVIEMAATKGRNGRGCVILFAAGNQARPLDGIKDGKRSVQGFALHPNVIAVGASNSLDKHSSYSNFGRELSLVAPSSGSPGRDIVTTDRRGFGGYAWGDYTYSFGGTSSATPLAAGLAALLLSRNPELTAAEVREIMEKTADKIDEENGDYVDGHSPRYGHGRINAERAVNNERVVGSEPTTGGEKPDEEPDGKEVELRITNVGLAVVQAGPGTGERRLEATVSFTISGADAEVVVAERSAYQIQIDLTELDEPVASKSGNLEPEVADYSKRLQFAIPQELGHYELLTTVTVVHDTAEIAATREGPRFRVVP